MGGRSVEVIVELYVTEDEPENKRIPKNKKRRRTGCLTKELWGAW